MGWRPKMGKPVPVQAIFRYPADVGTEFHHRITLIKRAPPNAEDATITVSDTAFGDQLDTP